MTQSDVREVRRSTHPEPGSKSSRKGVVALMIVAVLAAIGGVTALALDGDDEPSASSNAPVEERDPYAAFLVGDPPTVAELLGFWRVDNGTKHWLFQPDGTFRYSDVGNVFTDPAMTGTWALDGDEITMTATSTALEGCIGDFFKVRASIAETGRMNFVQTDVSTASCSPVTPRQGVLEHMLPTEVGEDFVFSTERGFAPLTDVGTLPGFWMAEGGGYALEMNGAGEYVVADSSAAVVDYGTWTFANGDLSLTSHKDSPSCEPGDQLVLSGLEWVNPGTDAIRGKVTRNTCGADWTPPAWFLIPDSGS